MATFKLKKDEKSSSGQKITWNKESDFMVINLNGKKRVVFKQLGEKLIKDKKATKAEGELVSNVKTHEKKFEDK